MFAVVRPSARRTERCREDDGVLHDYRARPGRIRARSISMGSISPACRCIAARGSGIGYLPQEASIFRGLNVEDNIRAVLEAVEPEGRSASASLMRCSTSFPSPG